MKNINKKLLINALITIFLSLHFLSGCDGFNNGEDEDPGVILSDSKEMTSFSFTSENNFLLPGDVNGVFYGTAIIATLPFGTDPDGLVASFTITGSTAAIDGVQQISGVTANDFTMPAIYTITAEDGSEKTFTVIVQIAGSSAKKMFSFSFMSEYNPYFIFDVHADIDDTSITATVPYGISTGDLVACFVFNGNSVYVGGTEQDSCITHNDFTGPVIYTVEADDGSTIDYTITVYVATECSPGWYDCTDTPGCETYVSNDNSNCGDCGIECKNDHGTAQCESGVCNITCDDWWADCNENPYDGCEESLLTAENCLACGNQCTDGHGTASCETDGCHFSCSELWDDCNGNEADGCETSLTTLTDCGSCGNSCSLPHSLESCSTGTCLITGCDSGWCDLNSSADDGCEHSLDTNPSCSSYISLGTVSGDDGSDTVQYNNNGEAWYRIYVAEYGAAMGCIYLSATIQLQPAAGTDYDLYVYCDNCTGIAGSSNNGGSTTEIVNVSWDEGCVLGVPTGTDSGRYIYIQVRYNSADTCGNYTLIVYGNTPVSSRTCSDL